MSLERIFKNVSQDKQIRNFISVETESHYVNTAHLHLGFLRELKLERKRQYFPVTFCLNLHTIKFQCYGTNIFPFHTLETLNVSDIFSQRFPFLNISILSSLLK